MTGKKHSKKQIEETELGDRIVTFIHGETLPFVIGLIIGIFSLYLLLAFTSYFFTGAADQSLLINPDMGQLSSVNNHIENFAGAQGAIIAEYCINKCFGIPSYFMPTVLFVIALRLMRVHKFCIWRWFLVCALMMIWSSVFLGFMGQNFNTFFNLGGLHGANISALLISQIGTVGMWMLSAGTAILFLIYFTRRTIFWIRKILRLEIYSPKANQQTSTDAPEIPLQTDEAVNIEDPQPQTVDFELDHPTPQATIIPKFAVPSPTSDWVMAHTTEVNEAEENEKEAEGPDFTVEPIKNEEEYDNSQMGVYNPKLDLENYHYPTLGLLKKYDNEHPAIDMEEQNANKDKIINTLRSFGIEISNIKATVGPTVTLYEITPEAGIRISKIRNLEDDIALSLSALGIRIIAPIPGKGTIGIEVPNSNPQIVSMHSIISSAKFQESKYDLPIALGKTITNDVFMVDLCKMPHILVAGATGQGKSVGLNAIITSLLYKKHPSELKFVLVDPKKVEFSIYNTIENHFLAKLPGEEEAIITDFTKVVQTLNSLCKEMDSRYDLLKKAHVRNIKEYNVKFVNRRLNPEKGHKYMPYIVVIIDEFGDLIMTAGKEVELPIARIAQLARAVGIHMIIATQRPTTNIITGTIKANFPARVAFRVSSMMDSRTILDRPGANQLIGRGDMLFLQGNDPVRVQCAFVDTPEVEQITNYINRQQGYTSAFLLPEYTGDDNNTQFVGDMDMNKLDSMFEDAARLIVIHQQGSTSLIQRKFAIGYNRAGRIMDQLEKAGIVGPSEGSKPRQVLCIDENDLQSKISNLI